MTNVPPPPPGMPAMPPMPGFAPASGAQPEHGPYTFLDAIKVCFSKYVTFKGRARRSEYWYWILFSQLASLVVGGWTIVPNLANAAAGNDPASFAGNSLSSVVSLVLLLPSLAVTVRRLHDVGKSGGWLLTPLIALGIALACGITAIIATLANLSDTGAVGNGAGSLWIAAFIFGLIGFALYIPIIVWLCKDGGLNTPNKYGVRD